MNAGLVVTTSPRFGVDGDSDSGAEDDLVAAAAAARFSLLDLVGVRLRLAQCIVVEVRFCRQLVGFWAGGGGGALRPASAGVRCRRTLTVVDRSYSTTVVLPGPAPASSKTELTGRAQEDGNNGGGRTTTAFGPASVWVFHRRRVGPDFDGRLQSAADGRSALGRRLDAARVSSRLSADVAGHRRLRNRLHHPTSALPRLLPL